jgi:hypothetical protein
MKQAELRQYSRTFSGESRPNQIGQFLVCGDLKIIICTGPSNVDYWLSIFDEDDLSLQCECDNLEMAIGIIQELGDEITLDWINSYAFEY